MRKKRGLEQAWDWIKALAVALVLALFIRHFLFTPIVVDGISMMPTLQDGDRLIANKIGYRISGLDRFDIIVFRATEEKDYIKRVIGLPGDHIEYRDDVLYINGEAHEEAYLDEYRSTVTDGPLTSDFELEALTGSATVPEGKYFVLGDNRRNSEDSRIIGFVAAEDVIGESSFIFWSPAWLPDFLK